MKTKILFGILIIILLIGILNAQDLTTDLDKTTYGLGEKVSVASVITNGEYKPVEFIFEGELYSDNPEVLIPRNFVKYIKLSPEESKTVSFEISTDTIMFDGVYEIRTRLLTSDYKLISKKTKVFNLVNAMKPLHVNLLSSKDNLLRAKAKTFLVNQNAYFGYDADVEGVNIGAVLIYPDKTTKKVNLPYSAKFEKEGIYELKVTATKQGCPEVSKTLEFAVIEKNSIIKSVSVCNSNGICENNENYKTCPQDCKPNITKRYPKTSLIVSVLVLLVLIYALKKQKFLKNK